MTKKLDGKVALITGSGRGIGRSIAMKLAADGARLVINDLDADEAHASAAAVRAAGGEAIAVPGSVTDANLPDALMRATLEAYGTPDVIVNNAGFLWDGVLHNMSDRQFEEVIACHLTAPFRLLRAAAPHMRGSAKAELAAGRRPRDRSIINVSSTSGLHGNFGQANYAAAKVGRTGWMNRPLITSECGRVRLRASECGRARLTACR